MVDGGLIDIGAVAEAAGLQTSALRYYEKVGLIRSSGRAGGRRQYDSAVFQRLAAVALFQDAGFTIAEIKRLLAGPARVTWQAMATQKLAALDDRLARIGAARELLLAAVRCDCRGVDTCELVTSHRARHRTVVDKLAPAREGDSL